MKNILTQNQIGSIANDVLPNHSHQNKIAADYGRTRNATISKDGRRKTIRKIVLNQFGNAWGYAEVEENTDVIEVFNEKTIDGAPVNVRTRKVSSAKKFKKQLQKYDDYEIFTKYEYDSSIYYTY